MKDKNIKVFSGCILKRPSVDPMGKLYKGAIILNEVDKFCKILPDVLKYFFIVERKGWYGPNTSKKAHIKLVDDLSCWEETKALAPQAILLDIGPPDFVNTDLFFPLGIEKEFDGIQISNWSKFKRHELFAYGAALLKDHKFIKFGHFVEGGSPEELTFKKTIESLSRESGANIFFPYLGNRSNDVLMGNPAEINEVINKCKMGILTTKAEGINRFKMECLAANIPVLVPADVSYPTRKHINDKTGYFFEPTPEGLARGVKYVEENYNKFSPREYVLNNTGHKRSLRKLAQALSAVSAKEGGDQKFDDIYWDGRNQSLKWGNAIFDEVRKSITQVCCRHGFKKWLFRQ